MATADRRQERLDRGIKVRSDGIYALLSWRELGYLVLPRLLLIVGLLLLPLVMPSLYWQRVISNVCLYALLALSFDFLAHYVGLVSLGGALFIGTGAYIAALLNKTSGLVAPPDHPHRFGIRCGDLHPASSSLSALERGVFRHCEPHVSLGRDAGHRSPQHFRRHGRDHGSRQFSQLVGGAVFRHRHGASFPVRAQEAGEPGYRSGVSRGQRQRPGGPGLRDEHHLLQGGGGFHRLHHGMPCRGLPDPYLHVFRDFPFCPGFLHPPHCGNRDRRRRHSRRPGASAVSSWCPSPSCSGSLEPCASPSTP